MIDEQDVLDRFAVLDTPSTRLTTEDLVVAGRRRVRRRRTARTLCGAALAVALLAGVPALLTRGTDRDTPASGARIRTVTCAVTALPVPAGMTAVMPQAIDPSGRYIVGNQLGDREPGMSKSGKVTTIRASKPVLWTDRRPRALPAPDTNVLAADVNAHGVVVALAGDRQWDSLYRYTNGVPQKLSTPPGDWLFTTIAQINADGTILANAYPRNSTESDAVVLVWKPGRTSPAKVPLPARATGKALLDDGSIVGDVVSANGQNLTSYVWDQQGHGRTLVSPSGQQFSVSAASGDWASGGLWPSGTVGRLDLRSGTFIAIDLHTPAGPINSRGWILADDTILRDDATVTLAEPDGRTAVPLDLSDTGTAIGTVPITTASGETDSAGPLLWTCGN